MSGKSGMCACVWQQLAGSSDGITSQHLLYYTEQGLVSFSAINSFICQEQP